MIGNFYNCGSEYYYCHKPDVALIIDLHTCEITMKENTGDIWKCLLPSNLNEVDDCYKDIIKNYITERNL